MREELSDENIISKDDDGLGEGGVVMVHSRVDDPFVENQVSEDVDKENLPLSNGKTEEMGRDFIGRSIEDRGYDKMRGSSSWNALYPLPSVTQAAIGLLLHVLPIGGCVL